MADLIWCWRKGNAMVYTCKPDVAKQARDCGLPVTVVKQKPHIFAYQSFYIHTCCRIVDAYD